jgi:hypothetical protein
MPCSVRETMTPWKLWRTTNITMRMQTIAFPAVKAMATTSMTTLMSKYPQKYLLCFRDYRENPELDRYEEDGIDDEEQNIINAEARR